MNETKPLFGKTAHNRQPKVEHPERSLAARIILQAIDDTNPRYRDTAFYRDAKNWLLLDTEDFPATCERAGVNADQARAELRRRLA